MSATMSGGLDRSPSGNSSRCVVPGLGTPMLYNGKVIGRRVKSLPTSANSTVFFFLQVVLAFLTLGVNGAREGDVNGGVTPSHLLTAFSRVIIDGDSLPARATTRFYIIFERLDATGSATPNVDVGTSPVTP